MKIELLSPAGNMQSLETAINNGANAVYLGLEDFNARGNIDNFSKDNLEEAVNKAHLFDVRVYLTLNILFKDEEIPDILELVEFALSKNVDAFIVQDIGLVQILFKTFEGIELHASTQMGISNFEGALFLSKMGFKRIVLARETPLNEIKRIKENLDVEIEYFVQGALCVGYSGNCYLSSLLYDKSGNRGKCKQLCRMPFTLKSGRIEKEGYLLSAKDFCLLPRLEELISSGVNSLKIEGRARRAEYVGRVTSVYRKAIDNLFKYDEQDLNSLKKVFNRGDYCQGYFGEGKIVYPQTQNHIGMPIGKVLSVNKGKRFNSLLIESNHTLTKGDAIKIFDREREVSSLSVQDVKNTGKDKFIVTTTAPAHAGNNVSLIVDSQMDKDTLSARRTIYFDAQMNAFSSQKLQLILDAEGQRIEIESEEILDKSISQPLTKVEVEEKLNKLGEDFTLKKLLFNSDGIFIRKSSFNALRRKAGEMLRNAIIQARTVEKSIKKVENCEKINKIHAINNKKVLYFSKFDQIASFIEQNENDYLIYSPTIYIEEEISSLCKQTSQTIFLDLPPIATKADIDFIKNILIQNNNLGLVANNYYALNLTTPDKILLGSELNIYSLASLNFYKSLGYDKAIISKERLLECGIKDMEVFAHAKVKERLIYFKHCPIKEHIGGNCNNCCYREGVEYILQRKRFELKRKKLVTCQFYLQEKYPVEKEVAPFGRVEEF